MMLTTNGSLLTPYIGGSEDVTIQDLRDLSLTLFGHYCYSFFRDSIELNISYKRSPFQYNSLLRQFSLSISVLHSPVDYWKLSCSNMTGSYRWYMTSMYGSPEVLDLNSSRLSSIREKLMFALVKHGRQVY